MFEVPRLKVKRGDDLLKEYAASATRFLESEPYALVLMEDMHQFHLVGEVRAPIPNELGLVLGDALHNLRSSLDVLANDAICKQTGNIERDASFPLAKDLETFDRGIARNLRGASRDLIDLIRNFQPFNRASPWLRRLHEFDIADKHRTMLPVVGNAAFRSIRARQRHTGGTMNIPKVELDAAKVGQQRILSVAKSMNFEFDPNVGRSFFFAITRELANSGTSVERAFGQMRTEVVETIQAVEGLLF